jgi:hypothetical protein
MNVKIQHPGLPDGYRLSLTGLNAILLNNEDVDVSEEAIAQYEAVTGKKFSDVIKGAAFTGIRPERPVVEVKNEPPTIDNDNDNENENDGVEQ